MLNQQLTSNNVDNFSQAMDAARKMQQDWLNYGVDFVHLYVEDVQGNWLENWGDESVLDTIKEFLVSDDDVAVKVRWILGDRSLFDVAVNLEQIITLPDTDDKLFAIKNLLAGREQNDIELLDLADSLLRKLTDL